MVREGEPTKEKINVYYVAAGISLTAGSCTMLIGLAELAMGFATKEPSFFHSAATAIAMGVTSLGAGAGAMLNGYEESESNKDNDGQ